MHDSKASFHSMVDPVKGTIERQIFSDEAIYRLELERIFARSWNFMCHESQIPKPGDFFLNFIGEESVIVTRDKKGEIQVLLNTCRHRGSAVCRAEQGNTRLFICTYHGWSYDLEGKLIGVPGYEDMYHEELDRSQWGLIPAAKVASYKGFVFANMDPDAPELEEFLGPVGRLGIDFIAARGPVSLIEGVQKNVVDCNWKLPTDNNFDWYHAAVTHMSAFATGVLRPRHEEAVPDTNAILDEQRSAFGEYGHSIGGPRMSDEFWEKVYEGEAKGLLSTEHGDLQHTLRANHLWRDTPEAAKALGPVGRSAAGHPNIFPNLFLSPNATQMCLRLPKGPNKTELWWFYLAPDDLNEEEHAAWVDVTNHTFGPAGMLEQDDGENFATCTAATQGPIGRRYPFNYHLNLGRGEVKSAGGISYVDAALNEHSQLWTWTCWADWMDAESWDSLRANHTKPPAEGTTI